jgi:hypothetical protein
MEKILNLTQHTPTAEQSAAGVVNPTDAGAVKGLLTFTAAPQAAEISQRADALAELALAEGVGAAMIGGAGYLMPSLERALRARGIRPIHSFTERRSVEEMKDGTVVKTAVFVHIGWVETPAE